MGLTYLHTSILLRRLPQGDVLTRDMGDINVIMRALAMELYERLFNRVMGLETFTCQQDRGQDSAIRANDTPFPPTALSLLDIFGFENLDINSLNQLLINTANERIQQLFVEQRMKRQARLLREEGLLDVTAEQFDNVSTQIHNREQALTFRARAHNQTHTFARTLLCSVVQYLAAAGGSRFLRHHTDTQ